MNLLLVAFLYIVMKIAHSRDLKHEVKRAQIITKMQCFEKTQDKEIFPELGDMFFFFEDETEERPTFLSEIMEENDYVFFSKKDIEKILKKEPDILVVNLFNEVIDKKLFQS